MGEDLCSKGGGGASFHLLFEVFHVIFPGASEEKHFVIVFLDLLTWEGVKFEFFALAIGGLALVFYGFLLDLVAGLGMGMLWFVSWVLLKNIVFEVKLI